MSRLTLSQRIVIESGIYGHLTFEEIARKIRVSPSSVSREIRANKTEVPGSHPNGKDCIFAGECKTHDICGKQECYRKCFTCREYDCQKLCSRYNNAPCSKLSKPPYVCNVCLNRRKCKADRAYYIAQHADAVSRRRNSDARSKIQTNEADLRHLDEIVTPLIKKGQPLTHIVEEHGDELGISQRTLYRYISQGVLSVDNFDLRRKLGYRPRRKKKEPTEGFLNQQFRKNRSYDDYLKYIEKHPEVPIVQMDTVKGCREQGKRLLTLHFCSGNTMLMFLMRDGKADTVVEVFDWLTSLLGIEEFRKIFPVILTDNGSEFKHTKELETTDTGKKRTKIFYCDPQSSWQKPEIEKNHEYIRYVIPKGKSLSEYTQEDFTLLMNHVNSVKRKSLNGLSPYETITDKSILRMMDLLGMKPIVADEVNLTPKLLKR